jgi:hypothetical protein
VHVNDLAYSLSLSTGSPSTWLSVSLSPAAVAPSGIATLTVTDMHPGPTLIPGAWYTIPITATGSGQTFTTTARLLVGGAQAYLPLVMRE